MVKDRWLEYVREAKHEVEKYRKGQVGRLKWLKRKIGR